MTQMKIARWGNSLAVRIPSDVVKAMELKEGETLNVSALSGGRLELQKEVRRAAWLERMQQLARPLPPGYKFDREEANAR